MSEVIYFVDVVELWSIIIGIAIIALIGIAFVIYYVYEIITGWLIKRRIKKFINKKV